MGTDVSARGITPDLGDDAPAERRSMLADLVEYEVLHGRSMSVSYLAGWIRSSRSLPKFNSVYVKDLHSTEGEDPDGDEVGELGDQVGEEEAIDRLDGTAARTRERAEEVADQVFGEIRERLRCLGEEDFPFDIKNDTVFKKRGTPSQRSACYVALLHLAIMHRYGQIPVQQVAVEFERLVGAALKRMGFEVTNLGTASDSTGPLIKRLSKQATKLGLKPHDLKGVARHIRTKAKDGGVDYLGRFGCGDPRPGDWVLFAQATVSRSEDWERKGREATSDLFPRAFPLHIPLAILAVPYHVERDRLMELIAKDRKLLVLDRVRLSRLAPECADLQNVLDRTILGVSIVWD